MSSAIKDATEGGSPPETGSADILLLYAYLKKNKLHPRRTLDQFFYHGIDTSERDTDQVVYRYLRRHNKVKRVFMVDQLRLWILGPGK